MTALKKMERMDREKAAEGDKKEGGLKKCLDLFLKIQEYHLVGYQNTYIQHKL
ncbi:hypothetical protein Peur_059120 [Populus x canadensis]